MRILTRQRVHGEFVFLLIPHVSPLHASLRCLCGTNVTCIVLSGRSFFHCISKLKPSVSHVLIHYNIAAESVSSGTDGDSSCLPEHLSPGDTLTVGSLMASGGCIQFLFKIAHPYTIYLTYLTAIILSQYSRYCLCVQADLS